ncbi:MAG: amidohydrolase family protein [Deltaproteobacteria bacterium]|nr:amidohydrolase family protein [Deltaproteobacteria bacterium]
MKHALVLLPLLACRAAGPSAADAGRAAPPPAPPALLERIDVHVHTQAPLYGLALKILEESGVASMVNLSGGPPGPTLVQSLEAAVRFPGRVAVCTNLEGRHIRAEDFGARMAADVGMAVRMGAACLKIPKGLGLGITDPAGRLLAIDDQRLAPVWEMAGKTGTPVFIHVGDPAAFWQPVTPANERYDELRLNPDWSYAGADVPSRARLLEQSEHVLAAHRGTVFVGVHFGNDPESVAATAERMRRHPNLWIDTAARVGEIGRQPRELLQAFFTEFQDRVMFGTDLGVTEGGLMLGAPGEREPQWSDALVFFRAHWRFFETLDRNLEHPTPIQGRWKVQGIGLPREVQAKFYAGNARRLLRWPDSGKH